MSVNKEHNPARVWEELDNETDNYSPKNGMWKKTEVKDREYGKERPAPPLTVDDSVKFGGSANKVEY